ncbi:hypothetical protein FAUST_7657 [Fusarium austroamericanum]|uniref:Uncharacterized protein n=1 Tax=Fusarium austroamericanum TaxID=282268 RepID=A0AAN5Z624_FUSAU|nr:hypothetical protein FAUST_7657 [Fusarium austroamericanum]
MLDICPQNLVVRKTKDKLRNMDTAEGESQVYLWSDNQSPGVPDGAYKHTLDEYYYEKNTLKQRYFVSSVANGTSTGVYRHHAVRMDSTAKCSVKENLLKSYSGKNPFRTSFVSERLKIEICVEGSYDAVPWTKSRDKQEHSERMWLSWTYDDSEDVEDEESVGQPIRKPNGRDNYALKCESESRRGWFELPSNVNGFNAGPLLDKWPSQHKIMDDYNDIRDKWSPDEERYAASVEDEGPSWREAFPIRRNNPLESRYMLTPGPLMTAALT